MNSRQLIEKLPEAVRKQMDLWLRSLRGRGTSSLGLFFR